MVDTEHSSDNNGADPAFTNYTHSHIARIIVMMMIIIVVMMIIVMMMMIVVMMMTIVMMMIKIIKSFAGKSGRQTVGKYGEKHCEVSITLLLIVCNGLVCLSSCTVCLQ